MQATQICDLARSALSVRPCAYSLPVNEYMLLSHHLPCPMGKFQVTIKQPRPGRDEELLVPRCQAGVELAAAAIAAEELLTAWTAPSPWYR